MPVQVRFYSDPACPRSWAAEPAVHRLLWEFGGELEPVWVMGGIARRYGHDDRDQDGGIGSGAERFAELTSHWLELAAESGMPYDPRIWRQNPLESTYPACQAVKAASEQGPEAARRYLRRLREGMMVFRRKLDHAEALLGEAGPAGLDRERFAIDLRSHAITEAFAADLEEVRNPPEEARAAGAVFDTEGRERVAFPSAVFVGEGGSRHGAWGFRDYDPLRTAALAAGATPTNAGPLEPLAAIDRFERLATRELEELAQRPRPVIEAEVWSLAKNWKLKPIPALTGVLWEAA